MILLGNCVWEGLSTEGFPAVEDGAMDGYFLKQLDTGESFLRRFGIFENINQGLSFIKATKSDFCITDENGFFHVSFTTPFINTLYTVQLTPIDTGPNKIVDAKPCNFLSSGFDVYTRNKNGVPQSGITISWLATRNYNP
jgi:hypothetical protein